MNMHHYRLSLVLIAVGFLLPFVLVVRAQAQDGDCAPVVAAFEEGIQPETCEVIEVGNACYASDALAATLRKKSLHFSATNDRVEIADIRKLNTQAPHGAAIMVAETPEDPVKIIIFGDASVAANGGNVFTMYDQNGQRICEKTPSGMMVQTAEGDTGQVVVNGVTIKLGSTAFIAMGGTLLFDQDPRIDRRYGERNPEAPLCSGFDSECDFGNCPVGYRLVWGPFCREDWYDYIKPGLYRVSLDGIGQVQAGATDYNATHEDWSYGVQNLELPSSYTFCYPGLLAGGTGFETLVKSLSRNARVDRISLEYLGRECSAASSVLSYRDQQQLDQLMKRWDEIRIASLNNLDSAPLASILTGSALEEQEDTLNQLRQSKCYWIIDELEPAQTIYTEATGPTQARIYALKNWDMDMVCKGKRLEMPDYDGNFIGAYTVQKSGGAWHISEKKGYDIEASERPSFAATGNLQMMNISNIEGRVEVSTLGITQILDPGKQVQVLLLNNRPVNISEPFANVVIPHSPLIDWLANDERAIPFINNPMSGGRRPPSSPSDTEGPQISRPLAFHAPFYPDFPNPTDICVGEVFKFALKVTDPSGVSDVVVHSKTTPTSGIRGEWSDWTTSGGPFEEMLPNTAMSQFVSMAYTMETGTHYLYITATDKAGNVSESPIYEFPIVNCP